MHKHIRQNLNRGFTLIELMIASSIFVVIVMIGTVILITATNNYRSTSELRQSMDTISFVMEDMTRNIRLGTTFHCGALTGLNLSNPCPISNGGVAGKMGGLALSFEAFDGDPNITTDQVIYWLYSPTGDLTKGHLYKKSESSLGSPGSTPAAPLFAQITPDDVNINLNKSGFAVSNMGSNTNPITPAVTMHLSGNVAYHSTTLPFDIQATIAPRNLPNPSQ